VVDNQKLRLALAAEPIEYVGPPLDAQVIIAQSFKGIVKALRTDGGKPPAPESKFKGKG
jgi:hypothetical protein